MKQPTEREMMELETMLDRCQYDIRKCLGIARRIMEYHKPNRQKTVISYLDRPDWKKHQKDLRDK